MADHHSEHTEHEHIGIPGYLGVFAVLIVGTILTYFAASRTIDFLIHGIEEYTAVVITSEKSEEIREAIVRDLKRTVTIYKGRGGRSDDKLDILYCVITRLEIGNVKNIAQAIDPTAFIITHSLADVEGGVIKKTALH